MDTKNALFICKYKNRVPDPGTCVVISINFEKRKLEVSNGAVRIYPDFDEVDIFQLTEVEDLETVYKPISFD